MYCNLCLEHFDSIMKHMENHVFYCVICDSTVMDKNIKDVAWRCKKCLQKCCNACIIAQYKSRNRKCPFCRQLVTMLDFS